MSALGRELVGALDAHDLIGLVRKIVDGAPAADAAAIAEWLRPHLGDFDDDHWLGTAAAAAYLGLDTANALHKIAARGDIEFEQDGPGAKLWFRRRWLDAYRAGIRPSTTRANRHAAI
jgi:hypothetical protein